MGWGLDVLAGWVRNSRAGSHGSTKESSVMPFRMIARPSASDALKDGRKRSSASVIEVGRRAGLHSTLNCDAAQAADLLKGALQKAAKVEWP